MKRMLLVVAVGGLAVSATGAMAQVRDPYGPGYPFMAYPPGAPGIVTGTCVPVPNASGSQTTNPCSYGNTKDQSMYGPGPYYGPGPAATGSIVVVPGGGGPQGGYPEEGAPYYLDDGYGQ